MHLHVLMHDVPCMYHAPCAHHAESFARTQVMVVTHGNTLRALVMKIDGVTEEDVYFTDVPTATPLLTLRNGTKRPRWETSGMNLLFPAVPNLTNLTNLTNPTGVYK